ncbi:SRPBCC family protein [Roseovarius sp. CAU 1744]|uniref:SRPBCC family protein n=1 Tax=Roseovarius sp. CAU 1744 TaxID=3140368 RepID=UPI00325BBA2B
MSSRMLKSHWRIEATIEEVADVLGDVERLPDWWGGVYLSVRVVEAGDDSGLGRKVAFHSRGRLPYTLRWQGTITEVNRPNSWTIRAEGDLQGQGVWTLRQDGPVADIRYDWTVVVGKPVLRLLAPILWPAFAANHRWAMARGEAGLRRELARRRAG